MSRIIFGRTHWNYDPYLDFWKLVELSGFKWQYLDEIDWDTQQIVIATPANAEWTQIPIRHKTRLIHWNLERSLIDYPPGEMASPQSPVQADEVWASDRAMAASIGAKYVFLGGHRTFGSVDQRSKQFDYITLMYWSGRRQGLRHALQSLSCGDGPRGERHERLMASRLMISAHQDDSPWIEPLRYTIAGCYALPHLAERSQDSGLWIPSQHFVEASFEDLAVYARILLDDDVRLARLGAASWRLVCVEHSFKQEVLEAVNV